MQPLFKDILLQEQFDEKGFVLLDAGLEEQADSLGKALYEKFHDFGEGFYYSLIANDLSTNVFIRQIIKEALDPFYEKYFINYRSFTESFLVKPGHTKNELLLHQDWNFTDETQFCTLTVWFPLIDVNEQNGSLFFMPGSHRWFSNLRSSTLPTARIASHNFSENIEKVEMRKGQVAIFHPAIFHGSYPNNTGKNRVVVTSTILPSEAPLLYYQQIEKSEMVKVFNLDSDFFLRELETVSHQNAPSCPVIATMDYKHKVIDEDVLTARIFLKQRIL